MNSDSEILLIEPDPQTRPKIMDVWFDDGNTIVAVGDKRFCVYAGILSSMSSIFRDMFQVSKCPQQENVDGRPVVHLAGDSPEDVSYLLKAMHDIDFFLPPPARVSFAIASGILRTSTKYDIPVLRHRALLHLSKAYATSLSEWCSSSCFLEPSVDDHLGAIKLAREFDLQWIKPGAMYSYMTLPPSQTYAALHEGDMCDEDRRLCTLAILPLKITQFKCFKFLADAEQCSSTYACNSARRKLLEDIIGNESSEFLSKTIRKPESFCSSCRNRVENAFRDKREEGWFKIPIIFESEPWAVLDKLRRSIYEQ